MRIAELFAGIGGVTTGFMQAGDFEPVFLNDIDPIARHAFLQNYKELEDIYHFGSITQITGPELINLAGGEIDGLLGCPPCQGFSAVGKRRKRDERNKLIWEMRRLIISTRPKFFVLENVPALLNSKYFFDFCDSLSSQYQIASGVINAAEFGVPQLRRRAVVIGFSNSLGVTPTLPNAQYGGVGEVFDYLSGDYVQMGSRESCAAFDLRPCAADAPKQLVRLKEAISDLPEATEDSSIQIEYRTLAKSTYQKKMRSNGARFVKNHVSWKHSTDLVKRLSTTPMGECPPSHGKRYRNERYFSQAYARLHRYGLARTITTNFHNPGSGRYTHYSAHRALTIREALRIQGFPDRFAFDTDIFQSEAERMVGNAFPPPLARAVGAHIKKLLAA